MTNLTLIVVITFLELVNKTFGIRKQTEWFSDDVKNLCNGEEGGGEGNTS